MKNLKKFGAVALAAVMAVTFAPVASLDVFAAETHEVDEACKITAVGGDTYNIGKSEGDAKTDINGTVTIDLAGKEGVKINVVNAPSTTLVITNSKPYDEHGKYQGSFEFTDASNNANKLKSLKYAEGLKFSATEEKNHGADNAKPYASVPTAKVGSSDDYNYYTGNSNISTAAKPASAGAKGYDVSAVSGKVVVEKLGNGKTATVDSAALPGTTIKASTDNSTSLITVKTVYNFKYDMVKNGNTTTPSATYTDTAYYAGATNANISSLAAAAVPTVATETIKAAKNATTVTAKDFTYDRSITVRAVSRDPINTTGTALTAAPADKTDDDKKGITYFTTNPAKYIDADSTGIILLDGSKYVLINDEGKTGATLNSEAPLASKSVELIQAPGWTKDDKNGFYNASFTAQKASVTAKAPADVSVITETEESASDAKKSVKNVYFYGAKKGSVDYVDDLAASYAKTVSVDQLASDATLTVTAVPDDALTNKVVSKASGIGYYYLAGSSKDTEDVTYGNTEKITKDFKEKAVGTDDTAATWTNEETVFASKEIVADLKGVDASVTFKGEASAKETAKDEENGTKDWAINKDQKPEVTTTKVYRFNNSITGEHIYTSDAAEVATLQGEAGKANGWVDESADKNTFKVLPATSDTGVEVYRLFNSIANKHFYTTNKAEADAAVAANVGWKSEGVAFKAAPKDTTEEKVPVYRMRRPSDDNHLFTPDKAEVDWLKTLDQGWEAEGTDGIAFYAFK